MQPVSLLAVDDDPVQLEIIATAARRLQVPPIELTPAETASAAIAAIELRLPDMVICDQRLPDGNAFDVLAAVRERNPLIPVVVITAFESVSDAVELIKCGARDYLVKPLKAPRIQQVIVSTLAWRLDEAPAVEQTAPRLRAPDITDTVAESMKSAVRIAARAADSNVSILIQGESGTGKELMARYIHANSPRRDKSFVATHVAALPETLVESELFGHTRGAFTGATEDREGVFERADGGTLFIDEISEIPLAVQVKLLRAIPFREIQRLGESHTRTLDVRIVAASNRNLESLVREGRFREDLYYRVNVIPVSIPPLRERRQDIPRLVEAMIVRLAPRNERPINGISRSALESLTGYDFPGNVRELENIVERAVVLCKSTEITEADLPAFVTGGAAVEETGGSLDAQLEALERKLILDALAQTRGHQSRAAELLEITERRLRSRMERLGIRNPY